MSTHVFWLALHQDSFTVLLGAVWGVQHAGKPVGRSLVEFWAAAKPAKAVVATRRVEYSMVEGAECINVCARE